MHSPFLPHTHTPPCDTRHSQTWNSVSCHHPSGILTHSHTHMPTPRWHLQIGSVWEMGEWFPLLMKNLLCSRGRKAKGGGDEDVFQTLISLDVSDRKYTSIWPGMDGWMDGWQFNGFRSKYISMMTLVKVKGQRNYRLHTLNHYIAVLQRNQEHKHRPKGISRV